MRNKKRRHNAQYFSKCSHILQEASAAVLVQLLGGLPAEPAEVFSEPSQGQPEETAGAQSQSTQPVSETPAPMGATHVPGPGTEPIQTNPIQEDDANTASQALFAENAHPEIFARANHDLSPNAAPEEVVPVGEALYQSGLGSPDVGESSEEERPDIEYSTSATEKLASAILLQNLEDIKVGGSVVALHHSD